MISTCLNILSALHFQKLESTRHRYKNRNNMYTVNLTMFSCQLDGYIRFRSFSVSGSGFIWRPLQTNVIEQWLETTFKRTIINPSRGKFLHSSLSIRVQFILIFNLFQLLSFFWGGGKRLRRVSGAGFILLISLICRFHFTSFSFFLSFFQAISKSYYTHRQVNE